MMKENWVYCRGDIYCANLDPVVGSEQGGIRPVIVIQNDTGNKHAPTLIVATVTTRIHKKANMPTHFVIYDNPAFKEASVVQLEQIRTIDKKRLVQYIGKLSEGECRGLNHALAISVGLIPVTSEKLTLCLCSACADNFYGSGAYFLRRVKPASNEKELCTYCSQRMGVEYEITKRKGH